MTRFTRREFLHAGALTLAASTGKWASVVPLVLPSAQASGAPPLFSAPHIIRYDAHCFTIRDRDVFLYSSSFHYPRCPEPLWRDRLTKLQRAGFNTIESYVFWNYHEPAEGKLDLGEMERFVDLVGSMGFWMILRPGPYVCAEWDGGGFPHWVIAKQFPLRSDAPESVATSAHWFGEVLSAIIPRQITRGGPVILMQIENEYNSWKLPEENKLAYVTALANMAWKAGIEIPLITCWTQQARLNENAAMSRIADFSNFYPRWNIAKEVIPGLEQLRKQQPSAPVGITEMQGGWFGQFGGMLPQNQEGISPAQYNMIAKTAIEQGASFLNTYMGFGGTNFDWAAKKQITSYDYDAPLAEPGGLRDKYFAARAIGQSLDLLGPLLTRAEAVENGVDSSNAAVSATLRAVSHGGGRSGVLLLRENANADQTFGLRLTDPRTPSKTIAIPARGSLVLGARETKMCAMGLPIPGGELRYSTAEILAQGRSARPWVILYDEPGRLVEICLAEKQSPRIEGQVLYHFWRQENGEAIIGMRVADGPSMILVNEDLQVILLPREEALRAWISPASGGDSPLAIPWFSDAALLGNAGDSAAGVWAELAFAAGSHQVTAVVPRRPSRCLVDNKPTPITYDREWQTARLELTVPQASARPIESQDIETWVERFDPSVGQWSDSSLTQSLEQTGPVPYGYVKYRKEFEAGDALGIAVTAFCDDSIVPFVNGRLLAPRATAGKRSKRTEFDFAGAAKPGTNLLEISYELFGSPNFGPTIGELKGVQSAALQSPSGSVPVEGTWQIQRFPAAMRGRDIDPDFSAGGWSKASIAPSGDPVPFVPAFTWCRASFTLEQAPANWQIPRFVTIRADRDALLYVNGKFVGRYAVIGPQTDFYVPESYLHFGTQPNLLTAVLAYTDNVQPIRTLRIAPYEEFTLSRAKVEFEW